MNPSEPSDVRACRYLPGVPCNYSAVPASTPGLGRAQTLAAAQLGYSFAAFVIGLALSGLGRLFGDLG